jgi:glycosyltransferase involved in cell wall biosynthesis
LLKNKIPFSFVCHSHAQYGFIPPHSIYPGAISIFKNAKNVFFVSNRQWHLTERRLIQKLKNAKFTWNPLGFPIGLAPLQWPAENAMQMAIVGNLDDMKGHDTVFEVLASDVWKSRYWHLNIYGNGQGINYLKDLAIYYNIFENITFQGYVNNIKEAWMNNHLLLIPSSGEGLPTSLIEAMVCGRPAVVTDVGGNVELVEENISGFIAASPTVSAFAEALEKAWKYRTGWQQMGKAAFETVTKIIDTDPHIKIYDLLKD